MTYHTLRQYINMACFEATKKIELPNLAIERSDYYF